MIRFYLFIPEHTDTLLSWQVRGHDGRTLAAGQGDWDEIARLADQWSRPPMTAWLDGRLVRYVRAKIPAKNNKQAATALPYAVEEAFAEDVEDLHFALGKRQDDGATEALAIQKQKLDDLVARFDSLAWWPDLLTADFLALPDSQAGSMLVGTDGWRLFLRQADGHGVSAMTLDPPLAEITLQQWIADGGRPEALTLWQAGEDEPKMPQPEPTVARTFPSLLSALMASESKGIHLLSGPYRRRHQQNRYLEKLKPLLLAIAVLLTLFGAWFITDVLMLRKQVAQLKAAQKSLYLQVFPGSQPRSPYREMRARLRAVGNADDETSDMVSLLLHFYEARKTVKDVDVRSLQYRQQKGELQIDVTVPDYANLEILQKALAEQGLRVEPVSATRTGDRYTGRLILRGGADAH